MMQATPLRFRLSRCLCLCLLSLVSAGRGTGSPATTAEPVDYRLPGARRVPPPAPVPAHLRQTNIAPTQFDVIGPFPTGRRQLAGDVLASFGGIRNIPIGDDQLYPSELCDGGNTTWQVVRTNMQDGTVAANWANANFSFLASEFGNSVFNFQGWAVGQFSVPANGRYVAYCAGVMTFELDDYLLAGDPYRQEWQHSAVYLTAGTHTLYVPFSSSFQIRITGLPEPFPLVPQGENLFPDVLNGTPLGNYVSVPLFSVADQPLVNVTATTDTPGVSLALLDPPIVQPGQSIQLVLQLSGKFAQQTAAPYNLSVIISTELSGSKPLILKLGLNAAKPADQGVTFRLTFLDRDHSVQYAQAIAPLAPCKQTDPRFSAGCPVLLSTHGAGSRAEWLVPYYKAQAMAWVLVPNGRTLFAYDWEGPQYYNALEALSGLRSVPGEMAAGREPDITRLLFAGHSMGGHGCYVLASMNADLAQGIACAAGWVRYDQYPGYFLNTEYSFIDPFAAGLLASSLADLSPDLHASNYIGVPFQLRAGGADEDVSPYHPRRMVRLYDSHAGKPMAARISEIPGEPHWWDGVVDDDIMQAFFDENLQIATKPNLPPVFTVSCANPARFGSRGGISVLQLEVPYRVGRVHVSGANSTDWQLGTENIRRFGFMRVSLLSSPSTVLVDGRRFATPLLPDAHFCLQSDDSWAVCQGDTWQVQERGPSNYGPARQVLEGPFAIVIGDTAPAVHLEFALYLANHFFVQGNHAVKIFRAADLSSERANRTNLILLGNPQQNTWTLRASQLETAPVRFIGNTFSIGSQQYSGTCFGTQFLQAWTSGHVAVVLAGTDDCGFRVARKLFPIASGMYIPDFVVAGTDVYVRGAGGYTAFGYWGNMWEVRPELVYFRR